MKKMFFFFFLFLVSLFGTWGTGYSQPFIVQQIAPSMRSIVYDEVPRFMHVSLIITILIMLAFNALLVLIHYSNKSKIVSCLGALLSVGLLFLVIYVGGISYAFDGFLSSHSRHISDLGFGPFLAAISLLLLIVSFINVLRNKTKQNVMPRPHIFFSILLILNILAISYIFYARWYTFAPYTPSKKLQTVNMCHVSFTYPSNWVISTDQYLPCEVWFKEPRKGYEEWFDTTDMTWSQIESKYADQEHKRVGNNDIIIRHQTISDYAADIYIHVGNQVYTTQIDEKVSDPVEIKAVYDFIASMKAE